MTRHLISRGHRRVAFITGPDHNYEAQERLRGYRAALTDLVPGQPELLLPGDFTEESGWRAGSEIATLAERPTAVFAGNDMMAIGCLAALAEAGVKVPQDIALAGFDDIPIARYVTPPLSTMRVRIAELGGHKSFLNPVWYAGSLAIGVAAGVLGDDWNLGFLAETERQVGSHLQRHLDSVNPADQRTLDILEQMKADEAGHAAMAVDAGARELPPPVKLAMRLTSRVMTGIAYYV